MMSHAFGDWKSVYYGHVHLLNEGHEHWVVIVGVLGVPLEARELPHPGVEIPHG